MVILGDAIRRDEEEPQGTDYHWFWAALQGVAALVIKNVGFLMVKAALIVVPTWPWILSN